MPSQVRGKVFNVQAFADCLLISCCLLGTNVTGKRPAQRNNYDYVGLRTRSQVGWINQKLITSNGEVCDTDEKADTCFYVNRKTWRLLDFMAKVLAWVAPKPGHRE